MSRHRDIRNLDYEKEYEEVCDDTVYGHSVDDYDYGVSPSTEQYLYSQKGDANYGFGAYFPGTENIKEEEEHFQESSATSKRRDSSSDERPRLSSENEVRLNSVLDELRNVVGDQFSEAELVKAVLENTYDFEASLNEILNRKSASVAPSAQSQPSLSQPPPSAKGKKEYVSMATQPDDGFIRCPFSLMLPLSYSFSSAFTFEKGKVERIPARQIVKEWYLNVVRNNRSRDNKMMPKEITSCSSQIETDDSKDDSDTLPTELGLLSVNSDSCSSITEGNGNLCPPKTGVGSSRVEVQSSSEEEIKETDSEISVSESFDNSVKEESTMKLQCTTLRDSRIKNVPLSLPKKEFSIPSLYSVEKGGRETKINLPPLKVPKKLDSETDMKSTSGFSSDKENQLSFGSPGNNGVSKISPVISQGLKTSKLASLASAHLSQVGKSFPVNVSRSSSSCSLPCRGLSQSPLDRQSSLSALASAHFEQKEKQLGAIPTFSSSPTGNRGVGIVTNLKVNLPPKNGNNNNNNNHNENHNFKTFKLPSLSNNEPSKDLSLSSLPPPPGFSSNWVKETSPRSSESEVPVSHSEESNDMEVDESSFDDEDLNLTIDLNVALTKSKQDSSEDVLKESNNGFSTSQFPPLINSSMEYIEDLTQEERKYLVSESPSLFGKILLTFPKKTWRRRTIYQRSVYVPYKPFDFASPSPDDLTRAALHDENNANLYKLRKRERRRI